MKNQFASKVKITRILTTGILVLFLCGCVGYSVSYQAEPINSKESMDYWKDKSASKELKEYASWLTSRSTKTLDNGDNLVRLSDSRWCGLVLFTVIPVPFLLPVCEKGVEFRVKNDVVVEASDLRVTTDFSWCSPFNCFLSVGDCKRLCGSGSSYGQ